MTKFWHPFNQQVPPEDLRSWIYDLDLIFKDNTLHNNKYL